MKGIRFYADLQDKPLPQRTTVNNLRAYAANGGRLNCVAVLLGDEHRCADYSQEAFTATFDYEDSQVSLNSVSREYLRKCRRIPEALARQLHPLLAQTLDES